MQKHQLKGSLMLFFCALIWGLAFVAQSVGADHVGAFTFNGLRSLIGAVFLIPCVAFFDRLAGRPFSIWGTDNKTEQQDLITGGIVCGIVLTIASTLQQIGIGHTTVGKAGFITTLYIVIVPLFGLIVHKTVTKLQWLSVFIAAVGMYYRKFQRQLRRYDHFGLRLLFRTAYHHYRTFFRIGRRCADVAAAICRLRYFKSACHLLL